MDVELSKTSLQHRETAIETLRSEFGKLPGVIASVEGFISERFDEVLSGTRANIAVKVYGPDLDELRRLGHRVQSIMSHVEGVVDLQLEPQVPVRQVQIKLDRESAARYGITSAELSDAISTALNGRVVSQILEQQQLFDLLIWLQPSARQDLRAVQNLMIDTPGGQKVPLAQVAEVNYGVGPSTINRENVSRRILISANAQGRDLRSAINEIQNKIKQDIQLPNGYFRLWRTV
jgi:Cu/Ag efflux pump CusA